jgi:hypothetical protein
MRALEDRFEEANDLVHFCRNSKCSFDEPGLGITHLRAYEHISSTELDRLTDGDLFKASHHLWDMRRSIAETNGAGSSRDLRGSDTTRGRPVSRGPAASDLSVSGGPKTSQFTTDESSLERLEDLRQHRKDIRTDSPKERGQALRDQDPREDEEPVTSPSSEDSRMRENDPSPMSDRMVSRVITPSGRSVKDSQLMVERAVDTEPVRPTDLPGTRRHVMGGSPCSRARSHERRRSPSLNSRGSGGSAASFPEAPSSGSPVRVFDRRLVDSRLAEGSSIMAPFNADRCSICDGLGSFPHRDCWFCTDVPSWHHGRCCRGGPTGHRSNFHDGAWDSPHPGHRASDGRDALDGHSEASLSKGRSSDGGTRVTHVGGGKGRPCHGQDRSGWSHGKVTVSRGESLMERS